MTDKENPQKTSTNTLSNFNMKYTELLRRRDYLVKKVLGAKGISKEVKIEICKLITDEEISPLKRGASKRTERDINIAIDYLSRRYCENLTEIKDIKMKYFKGEWDETTFYKALNKGINELERLKEDDIEFFEKHLKKLLDFEESCNGNEHLTDSSEFKSEYENGINQAKMVLELIHHHRNK
jgi:hypothetical protein